MRRLSSVTQLNRRLALTLRAGVALLASAVFICLPVLLSAHVAFAQEGIVARTTMGSETVSLQKEGCVNVVPALPGFLESFFFDGYTVRHTELCFPWEGGALTGEFALGANFSFDITNPIHGCLVKGSSRGTLNGAFTPRRVGERVVGGTFIGTVVSGVTSIETEGPCLDEPDASGHRDLVVDPTSVNISGVTWKASLDNGLLTGQVPIVDELPMLIAAPVIPPGGIEALGPLGQGPMGAAIGGLVGLIPVEAQGEIMDTLLGQALKSGSTDIFSSGNAAAIAGLVVDALLTGDASPELPSPEALAAAAAAGLIPMAAVLIIQSIVGAAAGAAIGAKEAAQVALETAEAGNEGAPRPPGLPATDRWNNPIYVREDGMVWWGQGKGPGGEGWVTADEARELLGESERLVARSDQWGEELRAASKDMVPASTAQMVAKNEREAALERLARERNDVYRNAWETIEQSAARRGDLDALLATDSDDLFNPDGTVNQQLIDQLSHATKSQIRREQVAAGAEIEAARVFETPGDEEYGDFTTRAVNELLTPLTWQVHEWGKNPFVRVGAGIATGGTSEIAFQSATGLEGIRAAEREAADLGIDYGLWDAARDGINTVVDENLPVHAMRKAGEIYDKVQEGEDVTLWDAAALAGDAVVDAMNVDTLRALGRSGQALASGAGAREVLFSGEGPPSLLRTWDALSRTDVRVSTEGVQIGLRPGAGGVHVTQEAVPEAPSDRLWREPSDVDWQTGGPSLRSQTDTLEERMARAVETNQLDSAARTRQDGFLQGVEGGRQKVDAFQQANRELGEAMASGDPGRVQSAQENLDSAVVEVQKDKHALNALKNGGDTATQGAFYGQRSAQIEQPAMDNTARRLAEEEFGIPREKVRVFNATNSPSPINEGYDLDVTYQQQMDDGTWVDIDHRVSGRVHNEELWKLTRPSEALPVRIDDQGAMNVDRGLLQHNADQIDHAVTDGSSHADAFPGHDLDTVVKPELRGRDLTDVEGVGLTVQHKGVERFARADSMVEQAGSLASRDASPGEVREMLLGSETERMEGARQLTKTWNKNLGLPRTQAMAAAGNAPGVHVPADLQRTMSVLDQIGKPIGQDGNIFTVVDAETTLQSMGMGPQPLDQAAEQLGSFVEAVQKLRPPTS